MAEFLVRCVCHESIPGTHVSITHLGGRDWLWTKDDVVRAIDAGDHTFWVQNPRGRRMQIALVRGALGSYVRGRADGLWTDDLLALPQCVDGG